MEIVILIAIFNTDISVYGQKMFFANFSFESECKKKKTLELFMHYQEVLECIILVVQCLGINDFDHYLLTFMYLLTSLLQPNGLRLCK